MSDLEASDTPDESAEAAAPERSASERLLAAMDPYTRAWFTRRPAAARQGDGDVLSARFLALLPREVRRALQREVRGEAPWPTARKPAYCLVEVPDGDEPHLYIFNKAAEMAEHVRNLEGQDVFVHIFWGIPAIISTGPDRIILLPDDTAYRLHPTVRKIPILDVEITAEDNGYLGPPHLRERIVREDEKPGKSAVRRRPRGDDDDFPQNAPA